MNAMGKRNRQDSTNTMYDLKRWNPKCNYVIILSIAPAVDAYSTTSLGRRPENSSKRYYLAHYHPASFSSPGHGGREGRGGGGGGGGGNLHC